MSSSYRCPKCNAFVSLERYINLISDFCFCRSCGVTFYVPNHFPDVPLNTHFMSWIFNNLSVLPVVPAPAFSPIRTTAVLQPNGKYKNIKADPSPVSQLDLFGGAA